MKTIAITVCLVTLTALSACSASTPASTPAAVTDTFFTAQALLDVNGNGQIDAADTPLAGATFIITLPGGAEFGAQTAESGKAFITVPSRVEYPVTARMEAPADSGLNIVEPSVITLKEPTGETVQFLFSK
ncbi:MAG: hypothetical protein HUU11_16270 [Anaerolineales bacterium]|nr:hypothetical protein [Anaerolineales bacterium]